MCKEPLYVNLVAHLLEYKCGIFVHVFHMERIKMECFFFVGWVT